MSSNSTLYNKISLPARNKIENIRPKMYSGFSTVSSDTENFKLYDYALIKQDLLNHFYVRQGERLMQPTFGTIIWDMLYEPLTDQVKNLIVQNVTKIVNYDPRVVANNVVVTSYESGIQIDCTLSYLLYNISEKIKLQFDQSNGLLIQ